MSLHLDHITDRCLTGLRQMTTAGKPEVLFAPYRICPIGAHIDHQGGTVLGQAVDAGTTLSFIPSATPTLQLRSANYPQEVLIDLRQEKPPATLWGRYVWAAARACADHLPPPPRGLCGFVEGSLPGGGLSSSASFILALQTALLSIKEVALSQRDRARLARRAENEFVGLACGILDQASILGAQKGYLLSIDAATETWEPIAPGPGMGDAQFLVCFSGAERTLATTDFNARVAQCGQAAAELAQLAGVPPTTTLGVHSDEVFAAYGHHLDKDLRKRATHFFTERARVQDGIRAWKDGDLSVFGKAMHASCESSIHNFEVGSPELLSMQKILQRTPGVLGSRFSGAGFAGCVLALIETNTADDCRESVREAFTQDCPELADKARFFLVASTNGVRFQ